MEILVEESKIKGLFIVSGGMFADERGFFREVFHLNELVEKTGVDFKPVQWNHSMSKSGVIRALHAENWNKLVYPVTGKMFVAIADIRPESPTFAKVETFVFDTEKERKGLFVTKGLANSICVVGDEEVHYIYLVDAYYDGKDTRAVAWNDPDLGIKWPIKNPILSERDKNNPKLRELFGKKFK